MTMRSRRKRKQKTKDGSRKQKKLNSCDGTQTYHSTKLRRRRRKGSTRNRDDVRTKLEERWKQSSVISTSHHWSQTMH